MEDYYSNREFPFRDFVRYFLGLEENGSVALGDLQEKMPYKDSDILDGLEYLEDHGYLESDHGEVKPVETKGFNDKLYNVPFESVGEERYSLTDKGRDYVQETGLDSLKKSFEELLKE